MGTFLKKAILTGAVLASICCCGMAAQAESDLAVGGGGAGVRLRFEIRIPTFLYLQMEGGDSLVLDSVGAQSAPVDQIQWHSEKAGFANSGIGRKTESINTSTKSGQRIKTRTSTFANSHYYSVGTIDDGKTYTLSSP